LNWHHKDRKQNHLLTEQVMGIHFTDRVKEDLRWADRLPPPKTAHQRSLPVSMK
jgi:hypothetical protein